MVNRAQHWHDFCAMIDHPEWADDATLDNVVVRTERSDELNPVIRAWAAERTTADIVELAALLRIPCIEVGNGETIPQMDHFASEPFYDVNPDGGFLQPAPPFRMHPPIPGVAVVARAPAVGPAITTVERPDGAGAVRARRRPAGRRPLDGLRVADFTSFWAGPVPHPHPRHVRRRRHPRRVHGRGPTVPG